MLQRWTSPLQGHSISDEIVSRGRVWGWFSAVCFQLLTFLIAFDASSWSLSDKTLRVGEGVHGGCATGQNVVRFRAHFRIERSYPKRSASGARARGPTSIVWPRRPLRAPDTARGALIHPPATSRRGTFEPSRRRLPTRSVQKRVTPGPSASQTCRRSIAASSSAPRAAVRGRRKEVDFWPPCRAARAAPLGPKSCGEAHRV